MTLNPGSSEEMAETIPRAKSMKDFDKKMHELAKQNPDDEPSGKHTRLNEMDLHRDRKSDSDI